jgi:hypothetical protein
MTAASERDLSKHVIPAFPPWLDLPQGYIVNDWIAWQKGKLVAQRLREHPSLVEVAIERLEVLGSRRFGADDEWLELLRHTSVEGVACLLESSDGEGQRLRSSTPFVRLPFIQPEEAEAIRERAYLG